MRFLHCRHEPLTASHIAEGSMQELRAASWQLAAFATLSPGLAGRP